MFVLINLKTYDCNPVTVAEAAVAAHDDTGVRIGVAPQPTDIPAVSETGVETWAQHVDPIGYGSHTGSIHAAHVAEAGAVGTLLNHSEHQLTLPAIEDGVAAASRAGLQTVVCAETPSQIGAVTGFGPDAVAVEPPQLIGSGTPVSQADPDIVRDAVAAADAVDSRVDVYCGAGISTADDVVAARDLGAEGVLLASGVAAAEDPREAIDELVADL